jgi:hypothetical protein
MIAALVSILIFLTPFRAVQGDPLPFDLRARPELLFGKGGKTSSGYYDAVVTRQPDQGVAFKLPYTQKGGKFRFDLHHRLALTPDFAFPAEVTTAVEVITGGTNSLGTFTLSTVIDADGAFDEAIAGTSTADVDRSVGLRGRKTVTLTTQPGPQAVSIVGKYQAVTRGTRTVRVETPGARIATVSNFGFEDNSQLNPLKKSEP